MAKILLVDDDQKVLNTLEKDLRDVGEIYAAISGKEALRILAKEKGISVALVDIRMPGIDGIDLLERIKRKYPKVEVIMVTAFGPKAGLWENYKKCRKMGIYSFIEKPYSRDFLRHSVTRCLSDQPKYRKLVNQFRKSIKHDRRNPLTMTVTVGGQFLDRLNREFESLANDAKTMVLDMKEVTYVSPVGLLLLMKLHKKTRLYLRNVSQDVKRELKSFCGEVKFNIQ
jgi:DNA-binding NtrC family response regulator